MEDELAAGLTDLLLGAALLFCALRLRGNPGGHRYWPLMFWSAGAAALAGTAHHLLFSGSPTLSDGSWVVVGILVAVAISYLLAATAAELLGAGPARLFLGLRMGGLAAYLIVMATVGIGRTTPLVLSESVTMASVVALWSYALYIGQPRARRMLTAIAVSALPAVLFLLSDEMLRRFTGLDAKSLQHIAQIPGLVLLARAAEVRAEDESALASPALRRLASASEER